MEYKLRRTVEPSLFRACQKPRRRFWYRPILILIAGCHSCHALSSKGSSADGIVQQMSS